MRQFLLFISIIAVGILFISRLFYLQVYNSSAHNLFEDNAIRKVYDYPKRGFVYDRNGELLVANQPSYDVMVIPREVSPLDSLELDEFCRLLKITKENYHKKLARATNYSPRLSSPFVQQLSKKDYAVLVRLTDLRKNLRGNEKIYVPEKSYKFLKKSSLCGGEYLIANVGANIGDVYLMPKINYPATLGPNMYLVKFNAKILIEFAFIISRLIIKPQVIKASISAAQPKINKDQFRNILVPCPPLETQKQIVTIIEEEQKMVDTNKELIKLFEQKIKDKISEVWGK
jgi:hypothetical protein